MKLNVAQRKVRAPKEEAAPEAARSGARLEVMRLTREEMAFQPVPLLPNLPRLSAAALAAAPRLRQSGPFSAFTVPPSVADQQVVVRFLLHSLLSSFCFQLCRSCCFAFASPTSATLVLFLK